MENNKEVYTDGYERPVSPYTLLKVGERYYQTKVLFVENLLVKDFITDNGKVISKEFSFKDGLKIQDDIAYLIGDYYYLYRGKLSELKSFKNLEVGIYYDDKNCKYVMVDPSTKKEKEEFSYKDKICRRDVEEIRNSIMNHEIIIINTPNKSHATIPPESNEDDIAKKLIKRALLTKNIDLDQYKTRFASKNTLFNTMQVLRGDGRLSWLLFDRCVDVMNLKYTIILEENGGEIIGLPLNEPLVISSGDVIDINAKLDVEK